MNWKPKDEEPYFYISEKMEIWEAKYCIGWWVDADRVKVGNYFRTEAQAQTALKRIKNVLKGVKK
jgi:hypothetical protein